MVKCNNCGFESQKQDRPIICPKCGFVMHVMKKEKAHVSPSKKTSFVDMEEVDGD
jgi:DNA-directed RNA polymerase subunit RPC12/RpoP